MRGRRPWTALAWALASEALLACGPLGASGGGGEAIDSGSGAPAATGQTPRDSGASSNSPSASATDSDAATPASDAAAGRTYTVSGATIYDAAHQPHWFHGVDRPSLEWSSTGEQLSPADYMNMAAWKANVVRIALNQDFWLSDSPAYDAAYPPLIDSQVQWAEAAGLDVIVDLHWSDKGDFSQKAAQQRMADAHSLTFWTQVAGRYKADGRVLFELYNEPHDVAWEVWQNGGASGDGFTVVGMQQLYAAVRATGAENLVIIGGLDFAYDLSGVPAHRISGHNIVWATHPYNTTGKQPSNWDTGFGSLSATDPVMATEFGDSSASCGTDYYSAFIAYADAHKISWSGWAWYVSGCMFPSIITDWSGHPNAAGQIEKTALQAY
jgi:endoglucanase